MSLFINLATIAVWSAVVGVCVYYISTARRS
jgi:hypothetical protein